MCHLCDDGDPDSFFESCVCIKCGTPVCYDRDDCARPAIDWDKSLICQPCFDAEIAESTKV